MALVGKKLVECIPNFSEGKNKNTIKKILESIESIHGIKLLHYTFDPSHHRTVVTFAGPPEAVSKAAFEATKTAAKLIDLSKHKGVHPRHGATDVLPFVPLKNISFKECVGHAKKLAEKIGEELKIPVYLYDKASKSKKSLPEIRKTIASSTNGQLHPDFGPEQSGSAGITIVGVRDILIAFNINLKTTDINIAKKIAKKIRSPYIRALGFHLKHKNTSQVSMNLINYKKVNIHQAYKKVWNEAKKLGIKILESELIGMIPSDAWKQAKKSDLKLHDFSEKQILKMAQLTP
ncbi:glutamate formimidoyltransferase [Candidatus Peregrinibacteria bacterium]|nr:glutamate formimidoyltransferase [Candidatus Peregrinibacteria bacterium]